MTSDGCPGTALRPRTGIPIRSPNRELVILSGMAPSTPIGRPISGSCLLQWRSSSSSEKSPQLPWHNRSQKSTGRWYRFLIFNLTVWPGLVWSPKECKFPIANQISKEYNDLTGKTAAHLIRGREARLVVPRDQDPPTVNPSLTNVSKATESTTGFVCLDFHNRAVR